MRWFEKISNKLSWLAIPNLTLILVVGSGTFFLAGSFYPHILETLPLVPAKVFQGEIWRIATFLFFPLDMHPIFAFFTYYLFFIMGSSLEAEWGESRYTLYVLIAVLTTVLFAFFKPSSAPTNAFIFGSIFLAFAFLYPNFTLYLFFVIPIKVKYIATITWIGYLYFFVKGTTDIRITILLSIANFLLFFGRAILDNARAGKNSMDFKAKQIRADNTAFHVCRICKITEKKDPKMDFRVCSLCKGLEYCGAHLRDHIHISNC